MNVQNSPTVTVNNNGIKLDFDKVRVKVGEQITFNIENTTDKDLTVEIPPAEIVPSPKFDRDAYHFPVESGQYRVTARPGRSHLVFKVKDAPYFEGRWKGNGMTYKFTIYANGYFFDPDLEINP